MIWLIEAVAGPTIRYLRGWWNTYFVEEYRKAFPPKEDR